MMSYTDKILRQQENEKRFHNAEKPDPSERRDPKPSLEEGIVYNTKSVLVRSKPKKDSSNVVGWMSKGTKVRIVARESGFFRVEIDGWADVPLYVKEEFIKIGGDRHGR